HQLKQRQAAKQSKNNRTEEAFPRFLSANMRNHQMTSDRAPCKICAHVGEFRYRDQGQNIELSSQLARARTRRQIDNFGDEIEKPEHVKQTEQRVGHRLKRFVMAQTSEHL